MPKMVVVEVFEVTASDAEAAVEKAKDKSTKRSKSMIYAAPALDQLPHPVHLAEAQEKFVSTVNEPDKDDEDE